MEKVSENFNFSFVEYFLLSVVFLLGIYFLILDCFYLNSGLIEAQEEYEKKKFEKIPLKE